MEHEDQSSDKRSRFGLLMISTAALAQSKPVAGEVAEGSLKDKTLTFVSYGGIYQDGQIAALKEFVDKSGVKLLSDGPTEISKLQAQVESGNVTWDVVDTGDFPPYVYCGKLFQKLDFSKIDIVQYPTGSDQRVQRAGHELWRGADVQHRKVQGQSAQELEGFLRHREVSRAHAPSKAAAISPAAWSSRPCLPPAGRSKT